MLKYPYFKEIHVFFYDKNRKKTRKPSLAKYFVFYHGRKKFDGRFFKDPTFKKFDGYFVIPRQNYSRERKLKIAALYRKFVKKKLYDMHLEEIQNLRQKFLVKLKKDITKEVFSKRPKLIKKILKTRGGFKYKVTDRRFNFRVPSKDYIKYIDKYDIKFHLGDKRDPRFVYSLNMLLKDPIFLNAENYKEFMKDFDALFMPHLIRFYMKMPTNRTFSYSLTLLVDAIDRSGHIIEEMDIGGTDYQGINMANRGLKAISVFTKNHQRVGKKEGLQDFIMEIDELIKLTSRKTIRYYVEKYMKGGYISSYLVRGICLKFNYKKDIM